jgi:hypothetical protein
MKMLRLNTASRHPVSRRRTERRSFVVLIVLTVLIWSLSTVAVQVL